MIGIIDFNPKAGTDEDRIRYVEKISALLPRNANAEGILFREACDLSRYSGLILTGSALSAAQYQRMARASEIEGEDYRAVDVVARQLADYRGDVFGICFGAQLAAFVAGGEVGSLDGMEVGYLPHELTEAGKRDPVFGHLPHNFFGSHLHRDFVSKLPEGGAVLATRNSMIYAYRLQIADSVWYGSQPHPEMSTRENAPTFMWNAVRKWMAGADDLADECKSGVPEGADYGISQTLGKFAGLVKG